MRYQPRIVLGAALLALLTAACSSTGPDGASESLPAAMPDADARTAELDARAAELDRREQMLEGMASRESKVDSSSDLLPPGADPGQCFTRAWNPPQYREVKEEKLVSEASEQVEVIPAEFGTVEKQVLVQEASSTIELVPAVYRTVTERVLVKPETTVLEPVPAVYETVEERVIDKPAHTIWQQGTGPIQRIDESTGEIMCLVEVPASYKTFEKQVLKTPASTRQRVIPAEYATVKKRVLETPATTRTVEVPAKYETVTVSEMIKPAEERRVKVPAKYVTVTRLELVAEGKMGWREILCDTNATPTKIREIQTALKEAGYDPGGVDGQVGSGTMKAVNAYQQAKGLPVDNYLNAATVRSLGVSLK